MNSKKYFFEDLAGTHRHAEIVIVVDGIEVSLCRHEDKTGKGALVGCGEKHGIHPPKGGSVGTVAFIRKVDASNKEKVHDDNGACVPTGEREVGVEPECDDANGRAGTGERDAPRPDEGSVEAVRG